MRLKEKEAILSTEEVGAWKKDAEEFSKQALLEKKLLEVNGVRPSEDSEMERERERWGRPGGGGGGCWGGGVKCF